MKQLIDEHGRQIRKLRLSLTDRCNLRCHYCMPIDMKFMDESRYFSADQYAEIIAHLCEHGLEEVRLTGGEPLMRKSFQEIVAKIAGLPLKKIGLTTNAILLDRHLDCLKRHGILYLNISLDSLDERNFKKITHGDHLARVLKNIGLARSMGFHIKINTVAMRGINDHELFDFVEWSREMGIEVRFLELMRIGHAIENQKSQFIEASEMIKRLETRYPLKPKHMAPDSTSFNFITACGAQLGFIASESKAFCGGCSRWRLSADGFLRACLLKDEGTSLLNSTPASRSEIFDQVLKMKPGLRPAEVAHSMNQIGG